MPYRRDWVGARTYGGAASRFSATRTIQKAERTAANALARMAVPRGVTSRNRVPPPTWRYNTSSGPELKVIDTSVASMAQDLTGSVLLLNGVATGTDFTDRIGRKICMKSILVRGVSTPQDGITTARMVRMMIVYDSQPNSAAPAVTDVLLTAAAWSPNNLNNRDRFRVLVDKLQWHGGGDTTAGTSFSDHNSSIVNKYKKINLETVFDGTGATISDIQSGSLYMITVGTTAAGTGGVFNGRVRVRFTDS